MDAATYARPDGKRAVKAFGHNSALRNNGRISLRWRRPIGRLQERSAHGPASPDLPPGEAEAHLRCTADGTVAGSAQEQQAHLFQAANSAVQFAIEQERLRIARDIHDHVGQHLVGILLRLAALEYRIMEPALRSSLYDLRTIIAQFGEELKAVSAGERCGVPGGSELLPALERLVGEWKQTTGISAVLDCDLDSGIELSDAVAEVVYRVVQEALTNVAKHARGATCVKIRLRAARWSLRLRVEDDGPGLDADPITDRSPGSRRGIAGMHERVATLGGALEIRRASRKGTCLLANIPLWRERNQAWETR